MNFFDEIFRKKWDTSRTSGSSSDGLQIREIPLHQRVGAQIKKTNPTKGAASATPKRPLRPETVTEPDIVIRRRNPQTITPSIAVKKVSRPISYQHAPQKSVLAEKSTTSQLKQAKSIPSLLEDTLRVVPSKTRGKTGKEHHHHHHHHQHNQHHQSSNNHESSAAAGSAATAGAPTPLPRTSSASANLNVLATCGTKSYFTHQHSQVSGGSTSTRVVGETGGAAKSARGKGGGSRERLIDGLDSTSKAKQQHQPVQNSVDRPVSTESVLELEQMQRQLQEMSVEKTSLLLQLEERLELVNDLQSEIKVLKIYQQQSAHQLEQKADENSYLRSKLRDVVHSPLSDSEKQQLLLIDSHRHHSSAPASIAVNVPNETGDATACPTPEWDKHSSSNVSDESVACLQDKINQMQETHYSTHEELQATLQELTDLQRQLTELQQHNSRLGDEKNLMFDSLCRQTDRLKESRSELDNLKQLINTTQDNSDADTSHQYAEREGQLLDIVQRLEVERDNLRDRLQEIIQDLQQLRISNEQGEEERSRLIERVRMFEGSIDAKVAENRQTEQELSQVRDECSGSKIEIDRLKDILESARTKIVELEQDRDVGDKSELDELLDAARKEKDTLELEITHLREQVARSRNEIEKLREQVSILQEECKVTRNNAKCTQSELDYKVETLISDKANLIDQLQRLQEAVGDLEVQNQCLNEDKRQLNGVLSETQRNLSEAEEKLVEIVEELTELKKIRKNENEEWEKFQNDLLTSVRVANDFKTEAQHDLQKNLLENKGYREKVRHLEMQMEKLKSGAPENPLIRSSIRRSIHVAPRKVDEIKTKMADVQDGAQLIKSTQNKLKDHKNSKLIIAETKLLSTKKQDGGHDAILNSDVNMYKNSAHHKRSTSNFEHKIQDGGAAILSKSLQDVNATISQLKNKNEDGGATPDAILIKSKSVGALIEDTTVYTGILAKPLSKPAKVKRQKTAKSLEKLLTEDDKEKFRILGEMLAHIDHSVPAHLLNEEDRSLLKLKAFYDTREMYRHKPIAKKPKDELCISNPLLNSVFANPALKRIAEDPNLPTVEPIPLHLHLNESFSFARKQRYHLESATMFEDGLPDRHRTYSTFKPLLNKSKSASNLCDKTFLSDDDDEGSLKRYLTEEDLSRNFVIAPSDSKLSLNLWTGTYTFSKQPEHRADSESSCDSDLHVYTVNEDINRSSSFVFQSLERKGQLSDSKTVHLDKKDNSEPSGRFRKFVGGLFGSKDNLGVIHEARNAVFAPKPEVVSIEADVHHSYNSFERPSTFNDFRNARRNSLLDEPPTSVQNDFEIQEKSLDFDVEDVDPTDSCKKQRALAESLCRSNFTEEEIQLVQKVVQTTDASLSRPQSDINNDDIIVIEWIDYCNQCNEVGTVALSLEEYSREIKSGRNISELDQLTRQSTELNERHDMKCLKAQDNKIKLDTLQRKYSLKDDLNSLRFNRDAKEFHYVDDLLDSWKSKTRKTVRTSIVTGPIYQNVGASIEATKANVVAQTVAKKAPLAAPRPGHNQSNGDSCQLDKMTDDNKPEDDADSDSDSGFSLKIRRAKHVETLFALPTLEKPNPPSLDEVSKGCNDADASNKNTLKKEQSYPTLERVAVNHVLNNNLPVFGKLNDFLGAATIKDEATNKLDSSTANKKDSIDQRTKFQISSSRNESVKHSDNKDSFLRAKNRFLQADDENKSSLTSNSPGSSLIKSTQPDKKL